MQNNRSSYSALTHTGMLPAYCFLHGRKQFLSLLCSKLGRNKGLYILLETSSLGGVRKIFLTCLIGQVHHWAWGLGGNSRTLLVLVLATKRNRLSNRIEGWPISMFWQPTFPPVNTFSLEEELESQQPVVSSQCCKHSFSYNSILFFFNTKVKN